MRKQEIIYTVQSLIQKASLETALFQEGVASKAGLSVNDMRALALIMEHDGISATELGKKLAVTTGAVTGIANRLGSKQLIYKQASKDDGRKTLIFPSYEHIMAGASDYQRIGQAHEALLASYTLEELGVILDYTKRAYDLTVQQRALLGS
jgi:DNA-binding MarR family transcriptional regulator